MQQTFNDDCKKRIKTYLQFNINEYNKKSVKLDNALVYNINNHLNSIQDNNTVIYEKLEELTQYYQSKKRSIDPMVS